MGFPRLHRRTEAELVAARAELAREKALFRQELEQRLEAEKRLREADARIRTIIEGAPVSLFATDRDGLITFSAGIGPDPLGKRPGEAAGWSAVELFAEHPDVVHRLRDALSGIASRVDLKQDERVFSLSLAPYRDTGGKVAGAIVVADDVSDRRQAEDALRKSIKTLRQVDDDRRALLSRLVTAQEEERRKIAADIHDDSIQSMFAVAVRLLTLRTALRDPAQVELIDRLQQAVHQASDRLRTLLFELRPAVLDEGGLGLAVREYLDVMGRESGIETVMGESVAKRPATAADVMVYRITQEALGNVRKHAKAKRVECSLSMSDGGIAVTIVDDGVGFDAEGWTAKPGHLGLIAMRERAEMAGGWLRMTSKQGQGCRVEFWIPDQQETVANAA